MQKEGIEEGAADTRWPQLLMPPGQHVLSNFMGFTECTTDDHVFGQMTPDRRPALFRDIDLPVWGSLGSGYEIERSTYILFLKRDYNCMTISVCEPTGIL